MVSGSPDADQVKRQWAQDRVQASHLRRSLDLLDRMREDKELFIEKTRGELRACRQRLELLGQQRESVAARIAEEEEAHNTAAAGRLQAVCRRLCLELEEEQELQAKIKAVLKENEHALWHIEMEKGQFEDALEAYQEQAEAAGRFRQARGAQQLRREKEALGKAERDQLLRIRWAIPCTPRRSAGSGNQQLVEAAQRSHRAAVGFLKASLGRVRERERQQELESREHLRRRMDAVLALKNSIAANRETLRKFQAWGQARAEEAERKAQAEKEAVLAQGGDAFKHLSHQRRRHELEAQRRAFEGEQKLRTGEIVSRILKEEAGEEKRRKKRQQAVQTGKWRTLRDRTWRYVSDLAEGKPVAQSTCGALESAAAVPEHPALVKAISSESVQGEPGTTNPEEETLAEPEIPGLWKEDSKPYQVPKEEVERKPVGGTKMEKDILARTLQRLREGLVRRQVVWGREFTGRPFNSKPELIHFQDFDVGKVYKKKITLVNATYTINYCRLLGVEEQLRDFIHIDFDPPGPMSAGMSCEVYITFKPMINKDLEGSVSFLAQTGRFSVPLKCSTKKCSVSLDKELIDFGSYLVGETGTRTLTLTNVGGLGTRFKLLLASEFDELEDSQSGLKTSSLCTFEDKSIYEKAVSSLSEPQLDGHESSPLDTQSRKGSEKLQEPEEVLVVPVVMTMPPSEGQMEISLGEVTEGEIGPFCSVKVPVTFRPVIPGEVQARFKVVFKNPQCPTLYFRVVGVAMDVPVWVPKPSVDLKICTYGRLYQDSILVHTRSKAALRLKFEVCPELRGHMELLPETGYIQALSSYTVQLKFLPRHSLPEDAHKYFDPESRVLEAPMTIWVADQVKPVGFTVHAVVTTSDLEMTPSQLDFGHCTIYEAVRAEIDLFNHSLLPQEFGFVGLPKFVDIQPNDGFGTILPLETMQLEVTFQPTRAKEYSFELVCKSEINRCFKLSCRAVGVHPPLELSHYHIKFAATALYDTSVATVYVINSHLSMNSLTHSVPRIGSEEASPVGPTSFEFLLPPDSPITISPSVGTVLPGKRCLVQVAFRPVLPNDLIRQEALQTLSKDTESKSLRKDTITQRKEFRRQSLAPMRLQGRDRYRPSISHSLGLQRQELKASAEEFQAAQAALARAFQGKFNKFVVPCVVASGDIKDRKGAEPLTFSPHNTLYLELWCPTVAPPIVVTSDKGKTVFNFGDVAVGHRSIKKVSIRNISSEDLAVEFSLLNPNGPFVLLNPLSKLHAGETQALVLCFSPHESTLAQETLDVATKRGTLTLTLLGTGVAPLITCSVDGGVLNMGYVIARESVSSTFKLQNDSSLPVKFSLRLESLSHTRAQDQQQLPRFLASPAQRTEIVGSQNLSGQSVFSVVPAEGVLEPGRAQDFTVTFSPDHESLYFSDRLQVVLFEKKVSHQILLKGAAREHMMFVEGGDPLDVPVESLAVVPALDAEHREGDSQPGPPCADTEELKHLLVTLDYVQYDTDSSAPPATRELQVGCIRTTQLSPKKMVEFSLDSVTALQHKGFSIEPSRGVVERGQTKTISISWVPPADFDPDHPLMVSALLQLRGGVKETYKVIFVAHVVTSP
ncbi:LOW QUALITY PROTEIN: cilia- and flagella-associated protein 74 [Lepus europaeus]|uniref:LOW QUALITY PROTEIN: cilia- and flagella-associated protein 74 n=1 Tax=Lepus europaeus TaxID=9983 RepID=UPI002B46643A|nr:LOW QUALITY PROTEIN: cilia- and flagella-associated protein 74 [Lepus europaeus]